MAEAAEDRSPVAIVEEWQARAWGDCDLSVVDELIAEPFTRHSSAGTEQRSRAQLKADLREYQKALGKPVIEVRDRVVDGDKVWSRTRLLGANLTSGEPRTIDWMQIHRVEDGQIVEVWTLLAADVDWER
jgi:ketosteroid isomerase-like protein